MPPPPLPSPTPLPSTCALGISGPIHAKTLPLPFLLQSFTPRDPYSSFPPLLWATPQMYPHHRCHPGCQHLAGCTVISSLTQRPVHKVAPPPGQALCWELELHTHSRARGLQGCRMQGGWLSEKCLPVKCQQAPGLVASLVKPFCGLFPLHL